MVDRLGSTLLHFVWQGAAVAGILAVALLLSRRASPGTRYGLALAAMAALAFLPVVTFFRLAPSASSVGVSGVVRFTPGEAIPVSDGAANGLPLVVTLWAFGVAALGLRLLAALFHLERWRRRHARPAPPAEQARLDALARRLGLGLRVRLFLSERIEVPSAWGIFRPVVVLPASLLMGLSPAGVEGILLHELAHVRRHDYLVNLLQSAVETALFYHPAVWWVSSVVRREREHLCDDVAVATLGDPMPYARALLHLEERRQAPRPALSAKEGKLMNRIARLLVPQPAPVRPSPVFPGLAAVAVASLALGGVLQANAQGSPRSSRPAPPAPSKRGAAVPHRPEPEASVHAFPKEPNVLRVYARSSKSSVVTYVRADEQGRLRMQKEIAELKAQLAALRKRNAAEAAQRDAERARSMRQSSDARAIELERVALQKELANRAKAIAEAQGALETARAQASQAAEQRQKEVAEARAEIDRVREEAAKAAAEAARKAPGTLSGPKGFFGIDQATAERTKALDAAKGSLERAKSLGSIAPGFAKPGAAFPSFTLPNGKVAAGTDLFARSKATLDLGRAFSERGLKLDPKTNELLFKSQDLTRSLRALQAPVWNVETLFGPVKIEADSRRVSRFEGVHAPFVGAVRTLAKATGLSVVIAAGSYSDVTAMVGDRSPEETLRIVCKAGNAELRREKGVFYVSPKK